MSEITKGERSGGEIGWYEKKKSVKGNQSVLSGSLKGEGS